MHNEEKGLYLEKILWKDGESRDWFFLVKEEGQPISYEIYQRSLSPIPISTSSLSGELEETLETLGVKEASLDHLLPLELTLIQD